MTHPIPPLYDPPHPTPGWPTPPHTYIPTPSPHHPNPAWPTHPCITHPPLLDPAHPCMNHSLPAWPTQPLYDPLHPCMTHPTPIEGPFGRHAALQLFHFTSWWKLFLGGKSRDPHWAYTGCPGCHQVAARDFQCQKFGVKIQNLSMFEELWQPLVSKVTGIGSPM